MYSSRHESSCSTGMESHERTSFRNVLGSQRLNHPGSHAYASAASGQATNHGLACSHTSRCSHSHCGHHCSQDVVSRSRLCIFTAAWTYLALRPRGTRIHWSLSIHWSVELGTLSQPAIINGVDCSSHHFCHHGKPFRQRANASPNGASRKHPSTPCSSGSRYHPSHGHLD